jgi:hypothetical protein
VAEKLGRRWVACDASPIAVHTARKRLLRLPALRPLVVQSAEARASDEAPRKLRAKVAVEGRSATIELASFVVPPRALPAGAGVDHWSQWLEGWCVDWDHQGGPLQAGSRVWRARGALPLSATHAYGRPGRYVALVKAFDVLGGATTKQLEVEVA